MPLGAIVSGAVALGQSGVFSKIGGLFKKKKNKKKPVNIPVRQPAPKPNYKQPSSLFSGFTSGALNTLKNNLQVRLGNAPNVNRAPSLLGTKPNSFAVQSFRVPQFQTAQIPQPTQSQFLGIGKKKREEEEQKTKEDKLIKYGIFGLVGIAILLIIKSIFG